MGFFPLEFLERFRGSRRVRAPSPAARTRGPQPSRDHHTRQAQRFCRQGRAPVPVVLSDCRASVSSVRQRDFGLGREMLLVLRWLWS